MRLTDPGEICGVPDFDYTTLVNSKPISKRLDLVPANLKEATLVIIKYHYLHRGRTMGQLPYWITLDGYRVGVILFALPRLSVTFHGYRPMELLELARLWLVPDIQGCYVRDSQGRTHSLCVASCAVARALRRCRQDWNAKYPHLPPIRAVISWADEHRHEGIVYSAANFQKLGFSGGTLHGNGRRRNGGRDQLHPDYLNRKRTFLFHFKSVES